MPACLFSRPLDWELSAADVLRLVRDDPHPVALLGAWAGGSSIIASCPSATTSAFPDVAGDGPDRGWWIGYLGFGAAGRYLPVPPAPGDPRRLPDAWWGHYDHLLRLDKTSGRWFLEAPEFSDALEARVRELELRSRSGLPAPQDYSAGAFRLVPSADEHRAAVRQAVEYIRAGDIFQANICLRLEAAFSGDPLDAFCAAAPLLDPPYSAFLRLPEGSAVVSLSPELFLRRTGDRVLSSPIKGTRARPADPEAARAARLALEGSAKDGAENVMIVDLMRNDLSRVCAPGTVEVPALLRAEPHPGVWHLVSDVAGRLRPGVDDAGLIAATFPPGSCTGAPKVRAMEVIHELEATPREAYTGAIGYVSPVAGLELNVAIRTFEFRGSSVWVGAGGGITARSDPDAEYRECIAKARPLIAALGGTLLEEAAVAEAGKCQLARPRAASGVFTSLRVTEGRAVDLDGHLARLEASTIELYGKRLPASVRGEIASAVSGQSGRLRVTARPVGGPLQVTVEVVPAGPPAASVTLRPVVVPGGIGAHKWRDRRLLAELGTGLADDEHLLIMDADGDVLETNRASIFAVIGGVLHTPPLDGRLLPGVTRAGVLRIAAELGIPVKEAPLALGELAGAAEAFVTNSVQGIVGVRSLAGTAGSWHEGLVTSRLSAAWIPGPVGSSPVMGAGSGRDVWSHIGHSVSSRPVIVLVDNYDSFTYNLAHLLLSGGCEVEVVRNDEVEAGDIASLRPDGIVISPGPCAPAEAGISVDVVRECGPRLPVLGVCLGHQAIAVAYGGQVVRAGEPAHGYASPVAHDGLGVLGGLPPGFPAARYHSLVVHEASLPPSLLVTARLADGTVMGLRHARHPVEGLQFHPESVLTAPHGQAIIANFIRQAGLKGR